MNVEITGRHVDITPAIRDYVMKRLRKFSKILGDDINIHVIIGVEKERQSVEILLKSKLLNLTGKVQTDDMYSSIVRALEKIERQAIKQKGKIIEGKRKRKTAATKAVTVESTDRTEKVSTRKSNGIYEEELQSKPMLVEEAVLELNHSEYPFVVFRNSESGNINILYRRKDGSLGLIHE